MFLLTYFRTSSEALHYAVSEDGLHWRALNDNRSVLESTVGAGSIRDPFVLRDKQGLFHAMSTNSWRSQDIWHAVSDDLVHWSNQELLPLMRDVPGAKNAWAPEAFWDAESEVYRLIWSSATGEPTDPTDWNHRIWSATTTDWQNFSAAQPFFDPGYSVIDACIVRENDGSYLMTFKDERETGTPRSNGKAICVARAPGATGPWTTEEKFIVPAAVEGPALFWREDDILGPGWTLIYDFFTSTGFGAAHCSDGKTWHDITERAVFPHLPRHAGVLEISIEEYRRLIEHFGV